MPGARAAPEFITISDNTYFHFYFSMLGSKEKYVKDSCTSQIRRNATRTDKEGRRAIDYAKENVVLYILGDTDDTLQLLERASLD